MTELAKTYHVSVDWLLGLSDGKETGPKVACVFLGASQVAPAIAKYVNQFIFGITHDFSLLFNLVDFVFVLSKMELTDGWTLLFMFIFMCIGLPVQLKSIKQQGYSYDTSIIAFETDNSYMHGKIIS